MVLMTDLKKFMKLVKTLFNQSFKSFGNSCVLNRLNVAEM